MITKYWGVCMKYQFVWTRYFSTQSFAHRPRRYVIIRICIIQDVSCIHIIEGYWFLYIYLHNKCTFILHTCIYYVHNNHKCLFFPLLTLKVWIVYMFVIFSMILYNQTDKINCSNCEYQNFWCSGSWEDF